MKKLVSLLIATVIGTCTVTYFTCFHHSNDTKAYAYEYYYNETNTQGEISLSSMEHIFPPVNSENRLAQYSVFPLPLK